VGRLYKVRDQKYENEEDSEMISSSTIYLYLNKTNINHFCFLIYNLGRRILKCECVCVCFVVEKIVPHHQ
jgi:hypothetical protein